MPPALSGVADYSNWLVKCLGQLVELEINPLTPRGSSIYHIGNNPLHRDIYRVALQQPGVVVIHDAVLNHFYLGLLSEEQYVEEFVYNYGEWTRGLAHDLWKNRRRSGADTSYFDYPMLRRITESAQCVVVHNQAAAEVVRAHAPLVRIEEIPHLYEPPGAVDGVLVERLRASWGATSSGNCIFGVFGHLREAKRVNVVMRAFERARLVNPQIYLLLAGQAGSLDMDRSLVRWGEQPGVVRVGHTPERDFFALCQAVDAGINLRYPSAGETSGITIRMMGMGKPVMVTDGPENAAFPDGACLKLPVNAGEECLLVEYMLYLAANPRHRRQIGERAAEHIGEHHSIENVARKYKDILIS